LYIYAYLYLYLYNKYKKKYILLVNANYFLLIFCVGFFKLYHGKSS